MPLFPSLPLFLPRPASATRRRLVRTDSAIEHCRGRLLGSQPPSYRGELNRVVIRCRGLRGGLQLILRLQADQYPTGDLAKDSHKHDADSKP